MRSIVLLSVLLLAVAVLARKDDVACVVHSDDCGKCVANGCNWCSDGYCVSQESDMCEASKVSTQCGANPNPVHKRQGSAVPCEANYNCQSCASANCQVCVDTNTQIFKCSSNAQCTADSYNDIYEWWIVPASVHFPLNFVQATACPVGSPVSASSPTLSAIIRIWLGPNGELPISYIQAVILGFLAGILDPPAYDARQISITLVSSKRQNDLTGPIDQAVLIKFADFNGLTAQGVTATLLDRAPGVFELTATSTAVTVGPYLPGAGTGQAVTPSTSTSGGSRGIDISKGALAGIIIGCVLGGALIIAIIAWFILRRRDAYPQAFRSPAAAYRP